MPQYDADPPRFPDKRKLRAELRARRAALGIQERRRLDAAIATRILDIWHQHRFKTVGVYQALPGEPELSGLYIELAGLGATLSLPVVANRNAPLRFAAWKPGDTLVARTHGVLEPVSIVLTGMPEALLIPCLGYTAQGYRLGYGGGYYDRTLAAASCRPFTVGVSYACLLTDFAPDVHDVVLDCVLTEAPVN